MANGTPPPPPATATPTPGTNRPPERGGQADPFGMPYTPGQKGIRRARRGFRGEGLQGPALQQAMQAYRDRQAAANEALSKQVIPPGMAPYVQNPNRFTRRVLGGKGPALRRLSFLQAANKMLGYDQPAGELQQHFQGDLAAGAPVDLMQGERPTYDLYGQGIRENLQRGQETGHYLSPTQEAAIRGAGIEGLEGGISADARALGQREAAAGIDPRSGVANQRGMELARMRAGGRADIERGITQENMQRQQQLETEAAGQAGLEEAGRGFDVGAQQRRLATVESGLANLSGLRENQRQYDIDYTESQRQANMARQANIKAARELRPTSLEKWSSGIGGFFQGLGV